MYIFKYISYLDNIFVHILFGNKEKLIHFELYVILFERVFWKYVFVVPISIFTSQINSVCPKNGKIFKPG